MEPDLDKPSIEFCRHFYGYLFEGLTIGKAFENSIEKMKTNFKDQEGELHTCCCAHEHEDHCLL